MQTYNPSDNSETTNTLTPGVPDTLSLALGLRCSVHASNSSEA